MNRKESERLFEEAKGLLPGGVNSPVRAFQSVHDKPFFVTRGKGPYLYDVDGNRYIDFVASWGAIILGHADDGLVGEITAAVADGTSFGACHPHEIEMARVISEAVPSIEMVRLTSSGTEATMSAIRVARGFSGKNGVIKFRGCYHGHVDSLLVKAGSGLATFGIPDSSGIPEDLTKHTFVADYNHLNSVERIVEKEKDISCIIMEPVMGNMGVILPEEGFLKGIEEICRSRDILLIFDEVITGFRVGYGGVQGLYGVKPDLTCLGKIIGGGFPIGAFGGRKDIMAQVAPLGRVYQAGTLSGNPVAVRAGLYVLKHLRDNRYLYDILGAKTVELTTEISKIADRIGIEEYRINKITGMFTGFFSKSGVHDYESALATDRRSYELFFKLMLEERIFLAPSPFEAAFLTLSLGKGEVARTLDAYEKVFRKLKTRL